MSVNDSDRDLQEAHPANEGLGLSLAHLMVCKRGCGVQLRGVELAKTADVDAFKE